VEGNTIRATIRNFVKLFFHKDLATKYSWSGKGEGRKNTKISFKDSFVYDILKGKPLSSPLLLAK